ncbi:MAG: hypothetical protein IPO06_07105 [Leptospiraceae bacterium]|nr:hypothetical protein [Leptospiraceae bacterium]
MKQEELIYTFLKNNLYPISKNDIFKGVNNNLKNKISEDIVNISLNNLLKGKIKKSDEKFEYLSQLFNKETDLYEPFICWLGKKLSIQAKHFPQAGGNGYRTILIH